MAKSITILIFITSGSARLYREILLKIEFKLKNVDFFYSLLSPGYPWDFSKNVSLFCLAVWPAIANIYTNIQI